MELLVFHVDVNSAFLSWEAAYRIHHLDGKVDLREVPAVIGGDVSLRRGIVLAKSIPANYYGINTGEAIFQAKAKCPDLYIAPPNYGLYDRCSKAFMNMLREYTPTVEAFSVDECYMDMTGCIQKIDAVRVADQIRKRIEEELGFTVNIGISSNKLLAKMASDFKKPNRTHTLFPEEIGRAHV